MRPGRPKARVQRRRGPCGSLVELAMGLGFAAVLIIVAWASSNAIRFVYGGY